MSTENSGSFQVPDWQEQAVQYTYRIYNALYNLGRFSWERLFGFFFNTLGTKLKFKAGHILDFGKLIVPSSILTFLLLLLISILFQRNWGFATKSDLLISISFKHFVIGLIYFKLCIMWDKKSKFEISKIHDTGFQRYMN